MLVRIPFHFLVTSSAVLIFFLTQSCSKFEESAALAPPITTARAVVDDSVLTASVMAALLSAPDVRSLNIGVETHQGKVLLSGRADDQIQIDLAVFVASNVQGVVKVDSSMSIQSVSADKADRQNNIVVTSKNFDGAVNRDEGDAQRVRQRQKLQQ
ncbi:BON domain-containing protein [Variovorax terrae]|uniref:BON domain-containing protein n=1 Tax=Variovorax terrae TaxID=2923278 RepID=A0A9X2AR34_9BURK|nr:BON domain-containing protein [Variovorax terrae]MCJ0765217.1 BON domain-containing protein [Variovorax terrae]